MMSLAKAVFLLAAIWLISIGGYDLFQRRYIVGAISLALGIAVLLVPIRTHPQVVDFKMQDSSQ